MNHRRLDWEYSRLWRNASRNSASIIETILTEKTLLTTAAAKRQILPAMPVSSPSSRGADNNTKISPTIPTPKTSLTGEAVLEHANVLGCDLLIKGAYTQSRLRQFIFGGTTRYILSNATLPVLMAH